MTMGTEHVKPAEFSVVIPTFRRPEYLKRCLTGLREQSRPPGEIIVVRTAGDDETREAIADEANDVREVVAEGAVVGKLRAGCAAARFDLIASMDDDTVPRRDWLDRLAAHFENRDVGVVGGRDVQPGASASSVPVGRVTKWGKLIGNHHLGVGEPRDVDVVKGCNIAFRRPALPLPAALRGAPEMHWEVAACLASLQRGWRVVYDPNVVVDHTPAPRPGAGRGGAESKSLHDAAYNLVTSLLSVRPRLWWRRALYGILVGDRSDPGIARACLAVGLRQGDVLRALIPSLTGQLEALVDVARGRRVRLVAVSGAATGVLAKSREQDA
jgi:hypothetical protein